MKRRKAVSVLLVMAMAASMLTGCGGGNTNTTGTNGAAKKFVSKNAGTIKYDSCIFFM